MSHTTPTASAISVDIAAPVTPTARPVPQPKMRTGASTMLMTTVTVPTIIPGRKFPVPRRAAPIATIANCSASAGMNQRRYSAASAAVSASALCARAYDSRSAIPTTANSAPTSIVSPCAWLNASRARSRSPPPIACATTAVVPTPSICVSASTRKLRFPAIPTAATARVPSRPTQ